MTITDVISKVDRLRPNVYSFEDKASWLCTVDSEIYNMVLYMGEEISSDLDISSYISPDKELILSENWEDIYLSFILAKIDYYNGEYDRCNNSTAMYNSSLEKFRAFMRDGKYPVRGGEIKNIF